MIDRNFIFNLFVKFISVALSLFVAVGIVYIYNSVNWDVYIGKDIVGTLDRCSEWETVDKTVTSIISTQQEIEEIKYSGDISLKPTLRNGMVQPAAQIAHNIIAKKLVLVNGYRLVANNKYHIYSTSKTEIVKAVEIVNQFYKWYYGPPKDGEPSHISASTYRIESVEFPAERMGNKRSVNDLAMYLMTQTFERKDYIVQNSDTLYLIAKKAGTTIEKLQMSNPTIDLYKIKVGDLINTAEPIPVFVAK